MVHSKLADIAAAPAQHAAVVTDDERGPRAHRHGGDRAARCHTLEQPVECVGARGEACGRVGPLPPHRRGVEAVRVLIVLDVAIGARTCQRRGAAATCHVGCGAAGAGRRVRPRAIRATGALGQRRRVDARSVVEEGEEGRHGIGRQLERIQEPSHRSLARERFRSRHVAQRRPCGTAADWLGDLLEHRDGLGSGCWQARRECLAARRHARGGD